MVGDASIDLRAMVREVLRETIAARGAAVSGVQSVCIASDADLQAFIARLVAPGAVEAVRAGTLRFSLAAGQVAEPGGAPMEGVISERRLAEISAGTTVKLAASAVLTPMGKDAARRLGLKFERIG